MKKIYIAPSRQTANKYCVGNTTEAVQCEAIAKLIPDLLKNYDCEVKVGERAKTIQEKAKEANEWGAEVYLSIHSNAGGGKGTECWYGNNHTDSKAFAQAIYDVIAPISTGKDRGLKKSTSFVECNSPTMPSCICEMDFHDWKDGAEWIINNHETIAKAFAEGLIKYLNLKEKKEEAKPAETKKYYRVQIGAYTNKANAEKMMQKLKNEGYSAIIKYY